MIPHSIEPKIISLENDENSKIVIFTGNKLRHKRFAYKIFDKFPGKSFIWYEIQSKKKEVIDLKKQRKIKKRILSIFKHLIDHKNSIFTDFSRN